MYIQNSPEAFGTSRGSTAISIFSLWIAITRKTSKSGQRSESGFARKITP